MNQTRSLVARATVAAFVSLAMFACASRANATPYSNAVSALNPISYYQFDGTIVGGGTTTDDGSRGATGTYSGGVSAGAGVPLPGMGGQSLSLSGAANMAATDLGLPLGNSARTITAWVNSTQSANGTYHVVAFYGQSGAGNSIFAMLPSNTDTNNDPSNLFTGNATNFSVSQYGNGLGGQTQVNDGNWHFLAVTATPNGGSNADYLIYVDGLLDGTGTYGGPKTMQTNTSVPGTNDSFFLGTDIFSDQYNGLLAQVAIFNTALNAQQIADLYLAAQTPPPAPEPSSLLLASLGMFLVVRRQRRK